MSQRNTLDYGIVLSVRKCKRKAKAMSIQELITSKLTKELQSETNIIRAVYGKTDSQISDDEWHRVIKALPDCGQSRNIGRNEYAWRAKGTK